jgi:hypothetical protein
MPLDNRRGEVRYSSDCGNATSITGPHRAGADRLASYDTA